MIIYCDRCKNEVHPLSNHCFYCGATAPVRTVVGDFSDPVFDRGIYCSFCGKQSPEDGAFCGKCGNSLFEKPLDKPIHCPVCAEKNSVDAISCSVCRSDFSDWYQMKGDAAQKLGFKGALTIKEKMTGITYHFISNSDKVEMKIGRSPENDIVIPCGWVSSNHCRLDNTGKQLIDDGSGNGTYINRSSDGVTNVSFFDIDEFNVAGSFTFNVVKKPNAFIFRLMAILDEEECNKNGDPSGYDQLRKKYYILLSGDQEIFIRKQDGFIEEEKNSQHDYYQVKYEDGFYYYSDSARGIEGQLLFKKAANWPVNWIVEP